MSTHYTAAGVDITAGDAFVERIKSAVASTQRPEVLGGIGGFAALFRFDPSRYAKPLLVSSTDGVGTKLRVAIDCRRFDTIGQDLVAMCANDLACSGAEPLFFLDYFATGKLRPMHHAPVIESIARACKTIGCALVGGETAEMPGMYHDEDFDLAGFVVGVVDETTMIDGRTVQPGHVALGVASSGFHSNGYSLVRKVIGQAGLSRDATFPGLEQTVGDVLLTPTHLYSPLVAALQSQVTLRAIAHITGGGLTGNIPRVIPEACQVVIDWSSWERPIPFQFMQRMTNMADEELRTVFNCGIGLAMVLATDQVAAAQRIITQHGFHAWPIGHIAERGTGPAIRYV